MLAFQIAAGILLALFSVVALVWLSNYWTGWILIRRREREDRRHVLRHGDDWSHVVYCNLCLNSPLRKRKTT